MRNPDLEAARLRDKFAAASRRAEQQHDDWFPVVSSRGAQRQRLLRWARYGAIVGTALLGVYVIFAASSWPPLTTARHFAAFPDCDSARYVGLAPARRGEPGYWSHLDRDKDGVACEPWPRKGPLIRLPLLIR
jgi:hypothetical protein